MCSQSQTQDQPKHTYRDGYQHGYQTGFQDGLEAMRAQVREDLDSGPAWRSNRVHERLLEQLEQLANGNG